jgi:hypothetical protein
MRSADVVEARDVEVAAGGGVMLTSLARVGT